MIDDRKALPHVGHLSNVEKFARNNPGVPLRIVTTNKDGLLEQLDRLPQALAKEKHDKHSNMQASECALLAQKRHAALKDRLAGNVTSVESFADELTGNPEVWTARGMSADAVKRTITESMRGPAENPKILTETLKKIDGLNGRVLLHADIRLKKGSLSDDILPVPGGVRVPVREEIGSGEGDGSIRDTNFMITDKESPVMLKALKSLVADHENPAVFLARHKNPELDSKPGDLTLAAREVRSAILEGERAGMFVYDGKGGYDPSIGDGTSIRSVLLTKPISYYTEHATGGSDPCNPKAGEFAGTKDRLPPRFSMAMENAGGAVGPAIHEYLGEQAAISDRIRKDGEDIINPGDPGGTHAVLADRVENGVVTKAYFHLIPQKMNVERISGLFIKAPHWGTPNPNSSLTPLNGYMVSEG
jgi:hypothetical protein